VGSSVICCQGSATPLAPETTGVALSTLVTSSLEIAASMVSGARATAGAPRRFVKLKSVRWGGSHNATNGVTKIVSSLALMYFEGIFTVRPSGLKM